MLTSSVHQIRWLLPNSPKHFRTTFHSPHELPTLPTASLSLHMLQLSYMIPLTVLRVCLVFPPKLPLRQSSRYSSPTRFSAPSLKQRSEAVLISSVLSMLSLASLSAWHYPPGPLASWESLAFGTRLSRYVGEEADKHSLVGEGRWESGSSLEAYAKWVICWGLKRSFARKV